MNEKRVLWLDKTIFALYVALAVTVPLIFTTQTTEVFEVPKMFVVYALSATIFFLTLIKFLAKGEILIPKNIISKAFAALVFVAIISTFFSIDKYTSIFGFPTRLNGGLLSQFAYFALFICALVNLSPKDAKKILIAAVISGFIVAAWGIPAHFNRDPSCVILTGRLTSACWQKDFDPTQRIFSTLGQPNWLASYLVLTIPFALAFSLIFKKIQLKIFFAFVAITQFLALVLTASRSGILGAAVAIGLLLVTLGVKNVSKNLKLLALLLIIFALAYIIFGTNLTTRTLAPVSQIQEKTIQPSPNLPTESAKIRLIVWQGAINIFRRWPLLGSGPETFVSSYYMFRPAIHNKTTEWEFFYNKAHNEFLNYLSTTGILGFAAYLTFLLTTLISFNKDSPFLERRILNRAALAATIGYLVTVFFGFSVVATQTVMTIYIATVLIISKNTKLKKLNVNFLRGKLQQGAIVFTGIVGILTFSFLLKLYFSNAYEKQATDTLGINAEKGLNYYQKAVNFTWVNNPYLLADFANSLASYLGELANSEELAQKAAGLAAEANRLSPNNYLIAQKVTKTYILIADYSPEYRKEVVDLGQKLTRLAPTYPDAYLTNAKVQIVLDNNDQALKYLDQTLKLKPDYAEAKELYEQLTSDN